MVDISELSKDSTVMAALVGAGSTLTVLVITGVTKPFWEKYIYKYKLQFDHNYEQKKKIKAAISKHKVQLLDSSDALNHRLWNFIENCSEGWLEIKSGEKAENKYYLHSFCYRFLSFFAWCRKVEKELIYLDSTLSTKDDLDFVKYIKAMRDIFCDVKVLDGRGYDKKYSKDHFFKDQFIEITELLIKDDGGVMGYGEFKKIDIDKYKIIVNYFSSIISDKSCNKWYMLNGFHLILISFLYRYGYDYQKTSDKKIRKLIKDSGENKIIVNINNILISYKLNKRSEITKVLKLID